MVPKKFKIEYLKVVKKLKAFWDAKTPKQKWQTILSVPTKMLDMIGIRLFSDMKVYWYSYSGGLLTVLYVILVSYTICYHFRQGGYLRGLESTYTAGTVSVVFRLYWKSIGPERFQLNGLGNFGGKYIFTDDMQLRFTRDTINLLYVESIEGPCLTVYSISFSIFGLFANDFPTGYGLAVGNFILLLILCSMGKLLNHTKERIESELYDMEWYMLPVSCQNHLVCVIHMIQHGPVAQMGPLGKLNMDTSAMLTKEISRFTIFLRNIYE